LGGTVAVETTQQVLGYLPAMFTVTLLSLMFSLLIGYVTHRQTASAWPVVCWGSIPGGLTQMIVPNR